MDKEATNREDRADIGNYCMKFSPTSYLKRMWNEDDTPNIYLEQRITAFHGIFEAGQYKGKRLLEIGSCSSVDGIISASKFFEEIYLTEYSEKGRVHLLSALENNDCIHLRRLVAMISTIEGARVLRGMTELCNIQTCHFCCSPGGILSRLKSRIKSVAPCDLEKDEAMLQLPASVFPVDALISCHTLEAVARDREEYLQLLLKASAYLKPGGLLVLLCSVRLTCSFVGDLKYFAATLSVADYEHCVKNAGFKIDYIKEISGFDRPEMNDSPSCCVITAVKL